MSKLTLFTLFLSAIIVVIVAELLVDQYIKNPAGVPIQANVLGAQTKTAGVVHSAPAASGGSAAGSVAGTVTTADSSATAASGAAATPDVTAPIISFAMIAQAGFDQVTLQRAPFNGLLFDFIDMKGTLSLPVTLQYLLKNNVSRVAAFYEFPFKSQTLVQELYGLLKQKSGTEMGAVINETNSFGENSFYLNVLDHPESAFLVVKKGTNVYALTYRKEYHPFIQQLLQELP